MRNTLVKSEPITNYELVEILVPASAVAKVAIGDQPQLKAWEGHRIIIKSIELINAKVLTNGPLSGLAAATRAETLKASLVLYAEGWEKIHLIPLMKLNAMHDSDATTASTIPFSDNVINFEALGQIDWTKSYVQYSNGLTSSGSAYCFMLGVNYVVLDSNGNPTKP